MGATHSLAPTPVIIPRLGDIALSRQLQACAANMPAASATNQLASKEFNFYPPPNAHADAIQPLSRELQSSFEMPFAASKDQLAHIDPT